MAHRLLANLTAASICTLLGTFASATVEERTLHTFGAKSATDGQIPVALIQARDGNLYGTTGGGGAYGHGTVFKITPAGGETILYSFGSGPDDGSAPHALIQGRDGNLYGTTEFGGGFSDCYPFFGCGTIFRMTLQGVETTLYAFGSQTDIPFDGGEPVSLIEGKNGSLYGTTLYGGNLAQGGTLFEVSPQGVETQLGSFGHVGGDEFTAGANDVIQSSNGNLYGTAAFNGTPNASEQDQTGDGTAFAYSPAGGLSVLYLFGGFNPTQPVGLVEGSNGNLYVTAEIGPTDGTLYRITPGGVATVVYGFGTNGPSGGMLPAAPAIEGSEGNFYGTTTAGGAGFGTVYEITPDGVETPLYVFPSNGSTNRNDPGTLIEGRDGTLYGITTYGGLGNGTVFELKGVITR